MGSSRPPFAADSRGGVAQSLTMTVSDPDIYRSAKLLVKQHGKEAPIHAALNADAMLEKGDLDGQRVWLRIRKAIDVLLDTRPGDGAAVH